MRTVILAPLSESHTRAPSHAQIGRTRTLLTIVSGVTDRFEQFAAAARSRVVMPGRRAEE